MPSQGNSKKSLKRTKTTMEKKATRRGRLMGTMAPANGQPGCLVSIPGPRPVPATRKNKEAAWKLKTLHPRGSNHHRGSRCNSKKHLHKEETKEFHSTRGRQLRSGAAIPNRPKDRRNGRHSKRNRTSAIATPTIPKEMPSSKQLKKTSLSATLESQGPSYRFGP